MPFRTDGSGQTSNLLNLLIPVVMSVLFQSISFFLLSFTPCFFLFLSQGRTVSCVLVFFSDGQNLIPLPLMCVSHATVTLLEQSMGARHVPRYTPTSRDTVCIRSLASLPGTPFQYWLFCLQNCLNDSWHKFNQVLERVLRDFNVWWSCQTTSQRWIEFGDYGGRLITVNTCSGNQFAMIWTLWCVILLEVAF